MLKNFFSMPGIILDQGIPWQDNTIPLSDFQPIDLYNKSYEYYSLNKDPIVRVTETRIIIIVIETCKINKENKV